MASTDGVLTSCSEAGTTFRIMWPSGKHFTTKMRVFIDILGERLFPAHGDDAGIAHGRIDG
ncbi:hypothetical protein [Caballeronia sp.]|jgi:hypothetical protein|uniref:hypothetical protein n=1 Tax=Caballeronia sp. TaxID=1931223 RepID=UPI00260AF805|nr:hypothetical protein [Caballeronia sp.]